MGKPKSLAMRKMEKNFIAHLDKKKPRKPYEEFAIWFLIGRLREETNELHQAILNHNLEDALNECADCSNLIDYIFEQLSTIQGCK